MRRPGHEAQWTQMIAATVTAAGDSATRDLARTLLAAADRLGPLAALGEPPPRLRVTPERSYPPHGTVDLVFSGVETPWELLCELKLHSGYGNQQIPRYLAAIDALPITAKGLIAVTKYRPPVGESDVTHPAWLGSVRWATIVDGLLALPIPDLPLQTGWRAAVNLLRDQGDFGMIDHADDIMDVWARRDEADGFVRELLARLGPEVEILARSILGGGPDDRSAVRMLMSGASKSQPIVGWKNKPHIDYATPAVNTHPRLRLQFLATYGKPYFTFETRYQHPQEDLTADPDVRAAIERLPAALRTGTDGSGHYCALVLPARDWLGPQAVDTLLGRIGETLRQFRDSGLLDALERRAPSTAASKEDIGSELPPGQPAESD